MFKKRSDIQTFKCLQGIEFDAVYRLLQSVIAGEASLYDMASQSISIKQLGKVQVAFMKATFMASHQIRGLVSTTLD